MNKYTINDLYGVDFPYSYLDKVIKRTLKKEKVKKAYFSIIFVDNEEIKRINREYRHQDKITDVISFALEDTQSIDIEIRFLGDIYICIPRMIDQANELNHSIKRELSFLTVHGLLHLLGYDHQIKEDEEKMFALQELILNEERIIR